ncbi:MAG: alpha/beta hydrolase [Pseudomonadota bacterium]
MSEPRAPFDLGVVAPETAAFNARLEAMLAPLPRPHEIQIELTRAARARGEGLFPLAGPLESAVWQPIDTGVGGRTARVRLSQPQGAVRGTYLHFHGGGWTFNAPDYYDVHNARIAEATGARVVSAEYRLAPENRWPAQAEDAMAAALWALESAPGPLVIGGESAGAHLALLTALGLRERDLGGRVAGLSLFYGMYDLGMTPSMRAWGARWLVLSTPIVAWFTANLLGTAPPETPTVSPLYADLAGLAPVLLVCGTEDPLIDDTLFLAARLEAARVACERLIVPGGVHAFDQFDLAIARAAFATQDAFIARCLG